jgi:7-carboxy-7-deazaguanine synthase
MKLPVMEIFGPTLQGEGSVIGLKTMFLRLAGCDYQCLWCDSAYTWKKGELGPVFRMEPGEIAGRLRTAAGGCRNLTITGGNPALHDLTELICLLKADGWSLNVETQGSIAAVWFGAADLVTLSPKGPSSGMKTDWDRLDRAVAVSGRVHLKVVVFDEDDYAFAVSVRRRYPDLSMTVQVGNRVGADRTEDWLTNLNWLAGKVTEDERMQNVTVLPQLHVLLWGNRRGV